MAGFGWPPRDSEVRGSDLKSKPFDFHQRFAGVEANAVTETQLRSRLQAFAANASDVLPTDHTRAAFVPTALGAA